MKVCYVPKFLLIPFSVVVIVGVLRVTRRWAAWCMG